MTKYRKVAICMLVLLVTVFLCILINLSKEYLAYADLSKPYKINFDYTYQSSESYVSEQNVSKSKLLSYDGLYSNEIEVQIYGDNYLSEITFLDNDSYISSTTLTIFITSKFANHNLEIKDRNLNSIIEVSNNSCIIANLSSGKYCVKYFGTTELQGNGETNDSININIEFTINIDLTAPSFLGTSLSTKGLCVNNKFQVSVADYESGIKGFYWRSPKDSAYSFNSLGEKIFSDNLTNGIYRFYAIDRCGNRTQINYVYYDDIAPTITISSDENLLQGNCTIDKDFCITTKDSGSGIKEILYQTPYFSNWQQYNDGMIIYKSNNYGEYLFKVTDYAGNISTVTVTLVENVNEHTHNYVLEIIAPTCTDKGYTVYACDCNDSYTDNYVEPLGHNYVLGYQAATCTEYGKTIYTCQLCGHEYGKSDGTVPKGHSYTNTILTEPTCTSEGLRQCICDDCGDTYETKIAANGHSYDIAEVHTSKGKTTRIYTCKICGDTYKQELGDQYEEVSNYIEYLFEQYSPYMWWVLLAATGIWGIVIGVMIAIAHKNEDKEKARKMLVNYVIGLVIIAIIVVACPFLIRGIAALIT